MNKSKVITLRVPFELKSRLEHEAQHQGVSMNNLANYLLATQLTQIEALSTIESRISSKNINELKAKVAKILDAVPSSNSVPAWDVTG